MTDAGFDYQSLWAAIHRPAPRVLSRWRQELARRCEGDDDVLPTPHDEESLRALLATFTSRDALHQASTEASAIVLAAEDNDVILTAAVGGNPVELQLDMLRDLRERFEQSGLRDDFFACWWRWYRSALAFNGATAASFEPCPQRYLRPGHTCICGGSEGCLWCNGTGKIVSATD
ncbi:MAG: hypothetical protein AB7K09_03955 [Planctomycetota bacterium]